VEERLQNVFRDIFADPQLTLTPMMTAYDVAGWDSLAHVELLMAVETEFGIRFTTSEIASLKQVGDLQEMIRSKISAKG
jgi:acyl carrier protein